MKAFLHYVQYEIYQLFHVHRRTVAVLVCLPFIYTVLFGGMFYPSVVKHVPIGIVNLDTGMESTVVIRELSTVPELAVVFTAQDEKTGQDARAAAQIQALVIIPPDFSKDLGQYKGTNIAVLTNNTNTLLGGTAMKNIQPVLATYGAQVQVKQAIAAGITPPA